MTDWQVQTSYRLALLVLAVMVAAEPAVPIMAASSPSARIEHPNRKAVDRIRMDRTPPPFDGSWSADKSDYMPNSKPVRVIPIAPANSIAAVVPGVPGVPVAQVDPAAAAQLLKTEQPLEQPSRHASSQRDVHEAHDICRGKGRTYTPDGRSWRCNR